MKKCSKCGKTTNTESLLVCDNCGAEICDNCNLKENKICPYCASELQYKF